VETEAIKIIIGMGMVFFGLRDIKSFFKMEGMQTNLFMGKIFISGFGIILIIHGLVNILKLID
jgi:hypothetical protein